MNLTMVIFLLPCFSVFHLQIVHRNHILDVHFSHQACSFRSWFAFTNHYSCSNPSMGGGEVHLCWCVGRLMVHLWIRQCPTQVDNVLLDVVFTFWAKMVQQWSLVNQSGSIYQVYCLFVYANWLYFIPVEFNICLPISGHCLLE